MFMESGVNLNLFSTYLCNEEKQSFLYIKLLKYMISKCQAQISLVVRFVRCHNNKNNGIKMGVFLGLFNNE